MGRGGEVGGRGGKYTILVRVNKTHWGSTFGIHNTRSTCSGVAVV